MSKEQKIEAEKIFGGLVEVSPKPGNPFNREEHETKDRSKIARGLIFFFLSGIGIILIGVPMYNALVYDVALRIDLFNCLTTYSGILGPFVGVISGYYFKK